MMSRRPRLNIVSMQSQLLLDFRILLPLLLIFLPIDPSRSCAQPARMPRVTTSPSEDAIGHAILSEIKKGQFFLFSVDKEKKKKRLTGIDLKATAHDNQGTHENTEDEARGSRGNHGAGDNEDAFRYGGWFVRVLENTEGKGKDTGNRACNQGLDLDQGQVTDDQRISGLGLVEITEVGLQTKELLR